MDKNQATGLVLISLLLLVYFYFFTPEKPPVDPQQLADTTQVVQERPEIDQDVVTSEDPIATSDSLVDRELQDRYGAFYVAAKGSEDQYTLENEDISVTFNSKGGMIEAVRLKKYETYLDEPLILLDKESSQMSLNFSSRGRSISLNELYFEGVTSKQSDSTNLHFKLALGNGRFIEQSYTLPPKGYQLMYDVSFKGMDGLVEGQTVKFDWNDKVKRTEEHLTGYHGSLQNTTVNYYTKDGEYDHLDYTSTDPEVETINQPLGWVSVKQKFFNAAIISENSFVGGEFKLAPEPTDTMVVKQAHVNLNIPVNDLNSGRGQFRFYFGPNNYQILKKVTGGFSKNVYMGWSMFSWINKFLVIPVFNFLEGYISNYGIIILILVIFIKILLSPLSYKSYVSMAKTKVLKPELDELKKKYGDDMQKIQSEQMKLYSQVGVNPISGCIPMLLQMPILLALFNFFPNSVELRHEAFLWAHDLSTYDAIISWGGNIPLVTKYFGNHISLFTLLMTVSTMLYTWSNNQMSAVQGPMKSIGYIMPVVFMFVLNSYPAGLTFYYFVANIITFGQQTLIRRFVDEEKIRKTLDENRKKNRNKKKSKFQLKLEEAMKAGEDAKKKQQQRKK
ncbi:membrane protein insertase YidC [Fulvivirgaceae bacterium BMA10]|uniref:Membrane protein insertase YidC n=1 Tax=Splendidivirga corallicola TaxID=3051826 RepID=A0ABT8KS68_9BACT|nr:membrane protein insertase YidC [Fulvivirgaceae bacterium BMA10]